ncbi:MAG TPA: methyl-accepting chemotaxis protein [Acetobacteraceae bacterium]|nr:methyl-accepting chemotaxis protein [Acetobacteraceae bacterium]
MSDPAVSGRPVASPGAQYFVRIGWLLRLGILVLLGAAVLAIYSRTAHDKRILLQTYQETAAERTLIDARHVQDVLQQIYQSLRVIAGMPGVRAIDRHADNLSAADRGTIQRIYDNLFNAIALTEIYVVPRELNPTRTDPVTHQLEAPDISFDSNVAGAPDDTGVTHYPEVETFEYAQMQHDLIPWMAAHYPRASSIKGLAMPIISGPEIITCDNTEYDRTRRDADRKGIVLAVPFYGPDGLFKGLITAIVRTNVLRGLLPGNDTALVNPRADFVVASTHPGQVVASHASVIRGVADPHLLFSRAVHIDLPDPRSGWTYWVGYPDSAFYGSEAYRDLRSFTWSAFAVVTLIAAIAWLLLALADRRFVRPAAAICAVITEIAQGNLEIAVPCTERRDLIGAIARSLIVFRDNMREARRLAAATAADNETRAARARRMEQSIAAFDTVIGRMSQALEADAGRMKETADQLGRSADRAVGQSDMAAAKARAAVADAQAVAAAAEQLAGSVREIGGHASRSQQIAATALRDSAQADEMVKRLEESARGIGEIVAHIDVISGQTRLLALNATIEAAKAGSAGAGFTVVASEVKTLAAHAAQATEAIRGQVAGIQDLTRQSVTAIAGVTAVIREMSELGLAISQAIDEQSATTQEIARAVTGSAAAADLVSGTIDSAREDATATGGAAREILAAATDLSTRSGQLSAEVVRFLADARAA